MKKFGLLLSILLLVSCAPAPTLMEATPTPRLAEATPIPIPPTATPIPPTATATPTVTSLPTATSEPTATPGFHEVARWEGKSTKNTETFYIPSEMWVIAWATRPGEYGPMNFQIFVYNAYGDLVDVAANVIGEDADRTVMRGAGSYYQYCTAIYRGGRILADNPIHDNWHARSLAKE